MLRVAIVGDHGSGKTTFLGLLYAALVQSGSAKSDELRFHLGYESLEEITGLFQRLMSGGFPDSATKEGIRGLSFELGVRKAQRGVLSRLGSWESGDHTSTSVQVALPGSLDDEASGPFSGSTMGTGRWRDVLDADVVVILVDAARLAPGEKDSGPGPMAAYDGRVESLFTTIERWRARGGRTVLHPFFVISKFDSVASEVVKAANLEPTPPDVGESAPRAAYANALLEPNLPRTLAAVDASGRKRLRFGRPNYFFSWMRTEAKAPAQKETIKLRRIDGGGWAPDYSRDEYLALLERIAEIAAETKD